MELKAICEMSKDELASEFLYCLSASKEDLLVPEERAHYRRRADAIKEYLIENNMFSPEVLIEVESLS